MSAETDCQVLTPIQRKVSTKDSNFVHNLFEVLLKMPDAIDETDRKTTLRVGHHPPEVRTAGIIRCRRRQRSAPAVQPSRFLRIDRLGAHAAKLGHRTTEDRYAGFAQQGEFFRVPPLAAERERSPMSMSSREAQYFSAPTGACHRILFVAAFSSGVLGPRRRLTLFP